MMQVTRPGRSTMVSRSRFFSTTALPPSEEETPPPNMFDRPPPLPLCSSTSTIMPRLARTSSTLRKVVTAGSSTGG